MLVFKDASGNVYRVEKGNEEGLPRDLVEINEAEAEALTAQLLFRPAINDGALDMPRAREIYKDLIRSRRDMTAADIKVSMALDTGDAAALKAASAFRQTLRDLTKNPEIDNAKNLENLRTIWPSQLLGTCPF